MSNANHEATRTQTVLVASVHDIRHFGNLLRGVSFVDFGTMTITNGGLTVFVEESSLVAAAAFIPVQIFDEFAYDPPIKSPTASPTPPEPSQTEEATVLEFPLRVFIDSLSIFSTGPAPGISEGRAQNRRWVRDRDREHGGDDDVLRGRIEAYFGAGAGAAKTVGMRLSYAGEGHPISLLIAEGSAEPDAKFEVTTYVVESQPDMSFDIDQTVLQLILKSSWLRDALSEIDPSCEKLTLVGNPPPVQGSPLRRPRAMTAPPIFRIQAKELLEALSPYRASTTSIAKLEQNIITYRQRWDYEHAVPGIVATCTRWSQRCIHLIPGKSTHCFDN
ncbi:repair protein Rad1/Rec1/Rad17-domain-containing protein [Multifurca ochricompacta]|uniref:Repair protein Rad1/Rec1/Rad17-domain-containing protein n=1 Tax=Multifurca ochricompacta TaxID=376703 RepID=A0AAD4M5Y9_9AGAM|nr:repair protein Rad1/Rec1/Rad17-domain-containing protein [Multifurca ochricompacta]